MEIRAYSDEYLPLAQRVLGDALDFAVNTLEMDPDRFMTMFSVSGIAIQFGRGNPSYVAGITGCELVRKVLHKSGEEEPDIPDVMYTDKSPEYWAGWILAFYQWYTDQPFDRILRAIPLSAIISMYPVYHEMDPVKFVEAADMKMQEYYPESKLKERRRISGLSQSELSLRSGVPLRQIQLFEQRQRDINKTQAMTLYKLGKALDCNMESLLER